MPGAARWRALHQQAITTLTLLQTQMQDYYEARSETWQDRERGDVFCVHLEALESVRNELDACL